MSTIKRGVIAQKPRVIVKAFRSEPVLLKAKSFQDDLIEVYGNKDDKTITLPDLSVFKFSESLFRNLRAAYESGDQDELARLWGSAEMFGCDESE
jgi:hypothetical protein